MHCLKSTPIRHATSIAHQVLVFRTLLCIKPYPSFLYPSEGTPSSLDNYLACPIMVATRKLHRPSEVLEQLIWLFIARKLYESSGSYEAVYEQWPFLFGNFYLLFQCITHTDRSNLVKWKSFECSFWDLLTNMKINLEDSDHCTVAARDIFTTLQSLLPNTRKYTRMCHDFIQLIVFFGSRRCLRDIHQFILDQGGALKQKSLFPKIIRLIRGLDYPHRWVTRAFNPNRIRQKVIRKSKRPGVRAARLFTKFRAKSGWRTCGLRNARRLSKRHVASTLGRTLGNFVGKNFFQLCKLAKPSLVACWRPRKADMHTEAGPGCRSALNQLEGFPKTLNQYTNSQPVADMYNALLLKWKKVWQKACKVVEKMLPEELQPLARWLHSLDEGGFQFVLCELSKILNFVEHEGIIYTRDYWADRL